MTFPLNRVIAFAGPYISVAAGGFAAWLISKANMLGIQGLDQENVATQASAGLTFTLVAALSWLGQSKWLTGHQLGISGDAAVQAAALAAPAAHMHQDAPPDPTFEALLALGEDLPEDEVEFASQPAGLAAFTPPPPEPASAPVALEPPAAGLPSDDEEFAEPPDQTARLAPDAPPLEDDFAVVGAEADEFAFAAEDAVRVAPEVTA